MSPAVVASRPEPYKPVNSVWTSIYATFPDGSVPVSILRTVLQEILTNFYNAAGGTPPPSLSSQINDPSGQNDVIVGLTSEEFGPGYQIPDFSSQIPGSLQHSQTPKIPSFIPYLTLGSLTDNNVLMSDDVNAAILAALQR